MMRRLGTLWSQRHMSSKYVNVTPICSFVRHRTGESPQRVLSFIMFHLVLIPIRFKAHKATSPLAFVFDIVRDMFRFSWVLNML